MSIQRRERRPDHNAAVSYVLEALTDKETGAITDLSEIDAVGHRIVHGGEKFAKSVVITDEVIAAIEECNDLAPLHNPANLIGIRACQKLMPGVPNVGVFDTAFHQTMPVHNASTGKATFQDRSKQLLQNKLHTHPCATW